MKEPLRQYLRNVRQMDQEWANIRDWMDEIGRDECMEIHAVLACMTVEEFLDVVTQEPHLAEACKLLALVAMVEGSRLLQELITDRHNDNKGKAAE